ncbi:ribosome small subunit-dependent GTPase A [Candidatus Phytoplasma australiense]|uniref:Small ribosomal subunit biogenesis GTPase RsgA n=1 Tax=Strawberry lethal yellows phytoplasma (CPA) str. NZSb11 TaxID=980422 RepID=R4RW93_PHYAS|nr:ribosome small subunit-dependent GTPase A [Candidatus Phytoplasma australiense]AGL90122.1 putative GTPase engC [Strawberry lethal yellows phytoplasma (CPA) str. NZSb11]
MKKALVIRFLAGIYYIQDLDNQTILKAQKKGVLKKSNFIQDNQLKNNRDKMSIKVGDIVLYEMCYDKYLIYAILPRKNELKRPNIANIDQVLLVFSLVKPHFQTLLLDKFLLILQQHKLDVILVFSKIDLIEKEELEEIQQNMNYYFPFYTCYYVDSKQQIGIDVLKNIFEQKITVLAGQTGVGKSTLLKALIPDANLKTQEISESLGRGKHTTKNAQLYLFNNGFIADTPGFSKLDLSGFSYQNLKNFYPDFLKYVDNCYFGTNCLHLQETQCGVKEALTQGKIIPSRYSNYCYFMEEIKKEKKIYVKN